MSIIRVSEVERGNVVKLYDPADDVHHLTGVSSITRSGAVATANIPSHGFQNSSSIIFSGADQAEYNVTETVTVVDADTVTFPVSGTPASPATGALVAQDVNQSRPANMPRVLQIEEIDAATTIKVEACIRRSLGWQQVGADLTSANNGQLVTIPAMFNFVRVRRSAGTGNAKIFVQS